MKKIKRYTYWVLLPALIIGFFLLTGGLITSPSAKGDVKSYTTNNPTIESFTMSPAPAFNNMIVTFTAVVEASSEKVVEGCSSDEAYDETVKEKINDLDSEIKIVDNQGNIVITDVFSAQENTAKGEFEYEYTFLVPGRYTVTATFTSKYATGETGYKSSSETMSVTIDSNGTYLPGSYVMTTYRVACTGTANSLHKTAGLQNNTLVIETNSTATLNINVTLTPQELAAVPCLGQQAYYEFEGSGKILIDTNEKNEKVFRIQYKDKIYVEALYVLSSDGSKITLSTIDGGWNLHYFEFTK